MKAIAFLPSSSAANAATPAVIAQKAQSRKQERLILPFYSLNTGAATVSTGKVPAKQHSVFECFWFN